MVAKTEKKDEKTSLGNKILDYVPWRTALTIAAFAIPVIGPVAGAVVGALAYGNYRKNNRIKDEESSKENAKPGRLEKPLSKAGTIAKRIGIIAIGFLFGGPIGGIIAMGLMVADSISGGKLIQGAEKALDAGYDILSVAGKGILDAGRQAVDKVKGFEKEVEGKGAEEKANLALLKKVKETPLKKKLQAMQKKSIMKSWNQVINKFLALQPKGLHKKA